MSRKSKIDPVLKVELVERYLRNEIGVMEAARLAGLPEGVPASLEVGAPGIAFLINQASGYND